MKHSVFWQAAAKSLGGSGSEHQRGLAEDSGILDWAQLVWQCPSSSSPGAARLVQSLPWDSLATRLEGEDR